jgi:hypothetical protein
MTQEDILKLAREAGFPFNKYGLLTADDEGEINADAMLERFAALVAAHTLSNIDPSKFMSHREGFEAGAAAEREACAKVCETTDEPLDPSAAGGVFAKAIRARGNK